jgi:hypothetical protein
VQLLDAGVDVRRVLDPRLEPHEHRHAMRAFVLRKELVPEAGRRLLPGRFFPVILERRGSFSPGLFA